MKKRSVISAVILLALVLAVAASLTACKLNLGQPQDVTYDGTVLKWSEVVGADHYLVQIEGEQDREIYGTSMNYDSLGKNFTVSVVAMPSGSGKIVKSNITTKDFIALSTITDLKVSDNGALSWSAVSNATGYIVRIGEKDVATVQTNAYDKLPVGEEINVAVRPIVIDAEDSYYSYFSSVKRMRILTVPENVEYDNSVITWNSVSNAKAYKVLVNSVEKSGSVGTSLVYNANNTDFDCEVQAIGDHSLTYDSAPSAKERFIYLDTVTDLGVNDGIISWSEIPNATSYSVKLTYNSMNETREVSTNSIDNLPAGVNMQVSVCPVCKGTNYFSAYSSEITAELLATPELRWDGGVMPVEGSYANILWNVINQATGYNVKVEKPDGTVENVQLGGSESVSPVFEYDFTAVGTYEVSVKATIAVGTGLYDSAYSKAIEVIRLPAPTAAVSNFITSDSASFKDGFTVTYQGVSNSAGYKLYYNNADSAANVKTTTGTQFKVYGDDLPLTGADTDTREVNCHIRSIGVGAKTIDGRIIVSLDSKETLDFNITVGATPTNVVMEGYYLKWDANGNASYGYSVTSGSSDVHTAIENGTYDMSYLEKGNYDVAVCTKGNGGNILASKFSNPIDVRRLGSVSDVAINTTEYDGRLTFTPYPDVDAEYVTYKVQFGEDTALYEYNEALNVNQYIATTGTAVIIRAESNTYNEARTIYYMSSKASDNLHLYYKLEAPTFSKFVAFASQTAFTWNLPANVSSKQAQWTSSYQVAKNGDFEDVANVTSNSYSLTELKAGYYQFYVRAMGDGTTYVNSDWAADDNSIITKLSTPQNFKVKDDKYVWDSVGNDLAGYIITIDGKESTISKNTTSFVPTFTKLGYVTVSIKAKGTAQGSGTISSNSYFFSQKVEKFDTPSYTVERYNTASVYCGHNVDAHTAIFVLDIPEGSNLRFCKSFKVRVNGTPKGLATYLCDNNGKAVYTYTVLNVSNITNMTFALQAVGAAFSDGTTTVHYTAYISSDYGTAK